VPVLVGVITDLLCFRNRRSFLDEDVNPVVILNRNVVSLNIDSGKVSSVHGDKVESFLVFRISKDLVKPTPLSGKLDGKIPHVTRLIPAVNGSVVLVDSRWGDVTEARIGGRSHNEAVTSTGLEKGDLIRRTLRGRDGGQLLDEVGVPVKTVSADASRSGRSDHVPRSTDGVSVNPVEKITSFRDDKVIQNIVGNFPLRVKSSTTVVQGQNRTSTERWEKVDPVTLDVRERDGRSGANRATDEGEL